MPCEKEVNIFPANSVNEIVEVFKNIGLESKPAKLITNSKTTLFFCSAIQQLEECWLNNKPSPPPYLTFQPVIRTQYIPHVNEDKGIFTSFINTAVIGQAGNNNENFYLLLDILRKNLSQIYGDNLRISEPTYYKGEWGGAKFTDSTIRFFYGNHLELGEVILKQFESGLRVIDCGFGFERLCLALGIFPWRVSQSEMSNFKIIDYLRTLTLLCGSGVEASQKERGYRIRLFANLLIDNLRDLNKRTFNLSVIKEMIKSYYDYFSQFKYSFLVDEDRVFNEVVNELRRSFFSKIFTETFSSKTNLRRKMGTFRFYCSELDDFLSQFGKDERAKIMEAVERKKGLFNILFSY